MELRLFQVDAFTSHVFGGNPAAVVPLDTWLDDVTLQHIANENNLSETAFFVPQGDDYHLRWFTPITEVDLCGHATLASAFVIFNELEPQRQSVRFATRSGELAVQRDGAQLVMDFPARTLRQTPVSDALIAALGTTPNELYVTDDYLAVFDSEQDVRNCAPNFALLAQLPTRGVIISAPGETVDFVSRFFVPSTGVNEDPVTGSAHCTLVPYWARRLDKTTLHARQVSARGGELFCELRGARISITGRAVKYLTGLIEI